MMKIVVLTEIINRKSGARAPLEIAKSLSLRNEITIFAYRYGLDKEIVEELKTKGLNLKIIDSKNLFTIFKVARELKKGKFDVVSFHGTLPFFLGAKLSAIPTVTTYYGTQLDPLVDKIFPNKPSFFTKLSNKLVNQLIKLQEKFILDNSDEVIAISRYTRAELQKLYSKDADFAYLGGPKLKTEQRTLNTKKFINILSVSRIVPYKGFHRLIKIFNKLNIEYPNIKLIVVGSSPNQKYLKYLKKISNKNVKFLINIPDSQLYATYYNSDIYTTFDRYMFFGMPVIEAASFGIPTVAFDYAAAGEVVKHSESGFIAKTDPEFEKCLRKLVRDRGLRQRMGQEAKRYSQNFTWEKLAKKYTRIFKNLTKTQTRLIIPNNRIWT